MKYNINSLMKTYTKADLEKIIMTQLENLNAMNDLVTIMKVQNQLLNNVNKRLQQEVSEVKDKCVSYRRKTPSHC